MDVNHYNELIDLSQKIYDQSAKELTAYLNAKYGDNNGQTIEQQMEDYLFIAVETSAYLLGNALALLEPDSQEEEIKTFNENLRRVIKYAQQKAGSEIRPS